MKVTLHLIAFFILTSLTLNAQWTEVEPLPGNGRHHPICFGIGDFGYVLCGNNDPGESPEPYLSDFYRYDPSDNTWTEMADFPGKPRGFGVGADHDGKGYVGFGISENDEVLDDLWEYDPVNDEWTELKSCDCIERFHPAFVASSGKLFVGQGGSPNGNLNDWWEYDIENNTWTEKNKVPGVPRHHPYYFAIDGIAYTMFGHSGDGIHSDVFAYNVAVGEWTVLNDIPSHARVAGTHFAHKGKGYVMAGDNETHGYTAANFWEYTPETDSWVQLETVPIDGRWAPGSFVVGNYGYFTSGLARNTREYHNDVWEYQLSFNTDNEELEITPLSFGPNPAIDNVTITTNGENGTLTVTDVSGKVVLSQKEENKSQSITISLANLSTGTYILQWTSDLGIQTGELIKK